MDNNNIKKPNLKKIIRINNLNILSINVNSIVSNVRRYNLLHTLEKHGIDIALVNETKLKNIHKIFLKKYNIIRNDRIIGKGGGTAIIIKKEINFENIILSRQNNTKKLESTIIKIKINNNKNLFILSVYSLGDVRTSFTTELQDLFFELKLDSINNYYLLAGDLNAKHPLWGDLTPNTRGAALAEWYSDNRIKFRTTLLGPEVATCPAGNSFLDLVLHDTRIRIINAINNKCKVLPYDSHHEALICKIKIENLDEFLFTPPIINNYNYNKTNWNKLKKNLEKIK